MLSGTEITLSSFYLEMNTELLSISITAGIFITALSCYTLESLYKKQNNRQDFKKKIRKLVNFIFRVWFSDITFRQNKFDVVP